MKEVTTSSFDLELKDRYEIKYFLVACSYHVNLTKNN